MADDPRDEIESLAAHLFANRAHGDHVSGNTWALAGQSARAFYRKLAREAMRWITDRYTTTPRSEHG